MTIMDIILNLQRYSTEVLAYKLDAEFAAAVDAAANLLEAQGERIAEYECTGYSPADFDRLCREMSDLRMAAGIDTYENLREALQSGRLAVAHNPDWRWIPVTEKMPDNFVSVLGFMTDAGPFPAVRECYSVGDGFFFPALEEIHPVSHWKPLPVSLEVV